MNITTKFETGSVVYAVHPCRLICGGQILLNAETGQNQAHADDIYIVSPHEVRGITASCRKNSGTEILYELSDGAVRTEQELSASFGEAADRAVRMYEKAGSGIDGKYGSTGCTRNEILKGAVCRKLQQALKAVLSCDQLDRFEEEFLKATQGLVFREA